MSSSSLSRAYSIFAFSGFIALASAPTAWSYTPQGPDTDVGGPTADYMPLGGSTSAPTGFLEMCMRSPTDCARSANYDPIKIQTQARIDLAEKFRLALAGLGGNTETASVAANNDAANDPAPAQTMAQTTPEPHRLSWPSQASASATLSRISYTPAPRPHDMRAASEAQQNLGWRTDFTPETLRLASLSSNLMATDVQPGALENAVSDAVAVPQDRPQTVSDNGYAATSNATPRYDWHGLLQRTPSVDARRNQTQNDQADSADNDYIRVELDGPEMALIRSVNTEVNHTIRQDTDAHIYHVNDYWVAPGLYRGARGDCEDLALQKRRELINAGVPAGALSIAIVKTYRGEDHAVLLVATREGDYVLDSLSSEVRPWRKTDYTWVSRQAPGNGINWVSLAPANTKLRGSNTVRVVANW